MKLKELTSNKLLTQSIIDYESGLLTDEEVINLFQSLITTGYAWKLQGSYGRTARHLIEAGLCTDSSDPYGHAPDPSSQSS